jgi:hypothetical protein
MSINDQYMFRNSPLCSRDYEIVVEMFIVCWQYWMDWFPLDLSKQCHESVHDRWSMSDNTSKVLYHAWNV